MPGTVALTGATGFIGSTLRRALVGAGYSVRALTRRHLPPEPGITWIPGDLADIDSLRELITGAGAVVHCAGVVRGASRAEFDRVNVAGTGNLLQVASARPGPPRLLFISSLAARHPDLSWYAASKAEAESLLARTDAALSWTIFRPTAVYGPGDREMRPLFQWLLRGWLPTPQPLHGRFSLLHVDDLSSAVLQWLEMPAPGNRVFELSDDEPGGYDARSLADIATARLGRPVRMLPLPAGLLKVLARVNLVSSRLLRRSPMLTPGKVRELLHDDWRADAGPFTQASGWHPRVRFGDALAMQRLFFT